MRLLRSTILTLAVCAASWTNSPGAHAQPVQGIYISGSAGLRAPFPTKNTSLMPGLFGSDFNIRQDLGYDGQISVGYALGNGWRFELEGSFGRGDIDRVSGTAFPATASGSIRNWGLMTNALFDLDVGSPYVYPYLGLGVGYQSTHLSSFNLTRTDRSYALSASGDIGGFAAQAIAGVSFPIPNMPGLSIIADYRLMDILGGGKFSGTSSIGGGPPVAGSIKFHNQFNQSVMLGVRYAFNTPPPAALAVAAVEPVPAAQIQTYLVYFDLNKATLNDRARGIVKEAAMTSTSRQTRIEVTGNTDTSGGSAYNQALSERRAKAVATALVGDGVPKDAISIQGRGDTNLAVPTGPGVVEARNRRVEIVPR
jgi:OOP family OmpA-OmpF porin